MSTDEQEPATDSIREIESRQDEVLDALALLEERLAALLAECASDLPALKKAA
ncbi:MAG TPA: hypothetical protein VHD36_10585 [Pirellulales bacterium]|nr:hypothetical protein [Pirellulales bacterium]